MVEVAELLYRSIAERWRPDDVASLLLDEKGPFAWSDAARAMLRKAGRGSYRGTMYWERYGARGFATHTVSLGVLQRLPILAGEVWEGPPEQQIGKAADVLRHYLRVAPDKGASFRWDRMNHVQRKAAGLTISRRQYHKAFRVLRALLRKRVRIEERGAMVRMLQLAKSGLAMTIAPDALLAHPLAMAFVAYYVARRQRQSVFTNKKQSRAWDEVSDMLFAALKEASDLESNVPWAAVALAVPIPQVLNACSEANRLALLISVYAEMLRCAVTLDALWGTLNVNPKTMIVKRGMNSSDWNAAAGAWNQLRSAWITMLHATGRSADLESFCPGKAMRLMAADVAFWHRVSGGDVDPNTKLFAILPRPWEVVLGKVGCTATDVREAHLRMGLDPAETGWLTLPPQQAPVATEPTPALVHGVAVSNPELADLLTRAGWFSGYKCVPIDQPVEVRRDKDGFATFAQEAVESEEVER
jgi:hypothetical protein